MGRDARWEISWIRVGLALLSVPLGLLAIGVVWVLMIQPLVLHVMVWNYARDAAESPRASLVPGRLVDTRVADLKDGLVLSRFGYSVQVPWTKIKVTRDFKTVVSTGFDDGSSLLIFDPADRMDMLKSTPENEAIIRSGLRPLLGEVATRSHYDYAKAELNTAPSDVSFFHSRHANYRDFMLLEMKFLEIPEGSMVIYPISNPQLRGFQFGDPKKVPTFVELLLFDEHDHALKLILKGPTGTTRGALTQEQINAVVASIQPVSQ